jgi:hypothetical protein
MKQYKFIWDSTNITGHIKVTKGEFVHDAAQALATNEIRVDTGEDCKLTVSVKASTDVSGSCMTRLHIECWAGSFTVRTNDISVECPVYIPEYHVIVTEGRDNRTFDEITAEILGRGLRTELQSMEEDAEENYENAAQKNINLHGPTWLGLGRDIRLFSIGMRLTEEDQWSWVEPRYAGSEAKLSENEGRGVRYNYMTGRGVGCTHNYSRRLLEGYLPILTKTVKDKDVVYDTTVFVSLESSPLKPENNRGTHYLAADYYGVSRYLTPEQEKKAQQLLPAELNRGEETVAYLRTAIQNSGKVPRHAWYKAPYPAFRDSGSRTKKGDYSFEQGYASYGPDRTFCTVKMNGKPLPQEEISVLVAPGEKILIDTFIPHMPINRQRAKALMSQDFEERLAECVAYWEQKESLGARISVPEKTVNEMIRAGLFHLDISTYGLEPDGSLTPTIGVYSALASESWPIVMYFESMGWHDVAGRCIRYFYDKQHEDGFMRNYGHYMLETGVALWFTAEHFLHTRDENWLKSLMPGIKKAIDCMLAWRERNKRDDLRGRGYGMLEGRSSDTPDDEQRMYLLNALTYKGLDYICRTCLPYDEAYWKPVCDEVSQYRQDIRVSVTDNIKKGPVVPLGDGTWCPTIAPWAGGEGPVALLNDGKNWHTHGMFVARDAHMHQLMFCGILDMNEPYARFIMNYHCEMLYIENVRPSQPYYSRHPYLHLLRGEAKAFIHNYYNGLTSLADRDTYSFWEHFFHASAHKTHEEGCFLMESRWMLYLEERETLRLLMGVPGRWMKSGKKITVTDASSHFGHFSLTAESKLEEGFIAVDVYFVDPSRLPWEIWLRIPHPEWKIPVSVEGGTYDEKTKCVIVKPVTKQIHVTARFK